MRSSDVIISRASISTAAVAAHYDELDLAYRSLWGEHVHHGFWVTGRETTAEATGALTQFVAARLQLEPGQKVVDVGCGYGATGALLAERFGVEVLGLTISSAQASLANSRPQASFHCLVRDWLDSGLADNTFDRALAIESSEHMVDKARFFAEAARVLKPGGRLVVCAWLEGPNAPRLAIRYLLEPICREGRLPSMGSRADYLELALTVGFELSSYEDISENVRRTWTICTRRLLAKIFSDPAIRRLALSRATQSRDFILSLPRLILALRTGAMRYGVFVFDKT